MIRTAVATLALILLPNVTHVVHEAAATLPAGQVGSAVSLPAVTVPPVTPIPVPRVPAPVEYVVPVECAQEDTCTLDYTAEGQWVLTYGASYTPERVFTVVLPVDCPAEDDCSVDYRADGHWVVTEHAAH